MPPPRPPRPDAAPATTGRGRDVAAVDLGSNSFHLAIARERGDDLSILDRVREPVRLAEGLDAHRGLRRAAQARALACLGRFGQRLRQVPPERVRAVATNTLRKARRTSAFLQEAQAALGCRIEILSGAEEARLIHLGVAHSLPEVAGSRLVVDIGGGSTECILGEGFVAREVHSLDMGCVGMTGRFFPRGKITRGAFERAQLAAAAEIQTIERAFQDAGWSEAVGASGTIRAAASVLRAALGGTGEIALAGLHEIRRRAIEAGQVARLALEGVKPERAAVFPGGLAILVALFERLGIPSMTTSTGALREGVMYDLLGRGREEDVRERTIRNFQTRHGVDIAQAERVERLVLALLSHTPSSWAVDPAEDGRFLAWAARLHEIGLAVSWSGYHRHSAYLIAHADMPGFSRDDQDLLAAVVGCQRRKIDLRVLEHLDEARWLRVTQWVLLLRLAVLIHRGRSPEPPPPLRLKGAGATVRLHAPAAWIAQRPLTAIDLESEHTYLEALDFDFALAR